MGAPGPQDTAPDKHSLIGVSPRVSPQYHGTHKPFSFLALAIDAPVTPFLPACPQEDTLGRWARA